MSNAFFFRGAVKKEQLLIIEEMNGLHLIDENMRERKYGRYFWKTNVDYVSSIRRKYTAIMSFQPV